VAVDGHQAIMAAQLHEVSSGSTGHTVAMRRHHLQPAPIACSAFARYFYPPDIIVLAVRWYLRFNPSYRDIEELLAERGLGVDHTTIYRWVQRFTPLLADAARPCRHAVGTRWQVDENLRQGRRAVALCLLGRG
jgi:hypothetical protein